MKIPTWENTGNLKIADFRTTIHFYGEKNKQNKNSHNSLRVAAPSLRFSFVRGSVRLHVGYKTDH